MLQRVAAELRTRQVNVKDDWLQLCMEHIRMEEGIGNDGNPRQLADAVFNHFLMADLNAIASQGTLPNVERMHKDQIAGSHLLQIDEMVNIEAPIEHVGRVADQDEDEEKALEKKQRHEADGARGGRGSRGGRGGFAQQNQRQGQGAGTTNSNYRTFKLSLTDGVRRVFALEYRRVPVLDLERTPPGTKILVRDVLVRRGVLLLLPQNVQVLGGRVASLVDAHLQTIEYKRKRGQGIVEEPPTVNATGAQQQAPDGDWRSNAAKRPRMEVDEVGTVTATTSSFNSYDNTAKAAASRPAASTSLSAGLNNSTAPKLRSSYSASSLLSSSSLSSTSSSSSTPTSSSLASSAATFAGAFASSLVPTTRQSAAPAAQPQSSTSTSSTSLSSSSSSSTSVVSIPFFSRSSSSSRSSATTLPSSATSRISPLTPPGIDDSSDSIEDDEAETKPTSAAKLLRVKEESATTVGSAEGEQPSSKPKGLSLSLKKKTIVKEEPAVEAVISLLDEELPSPIPVKDEPGQARPADDYLADVPDDFGFSLGDLAEFDEHPPADVRSPEPFVYIDELRPEDMATGRKVTLKAASIELLKGSFQYKTGKYSLELKLEDGSGTLQALMSDEVVAEMMGVTCTEFKANLTRGPEGINENKRRMRQLEVALFNLEGLMDLMLEDPKPLVTRVYRPTTEHAKQLLARVSSSSQLNSPSQRRNPLSQ